MASVGCPDRSAFAPEGAAAGLCRDGEQVGRERFGVSRQ